MTAPDEQYVQQLIDALIDRGIPVKWHEVDEGTVDIVLARAGWQDGPFGADYDSVTVGWREYRHRWYLLPQTAEQDRTGGGNVYDLRLDEDEDPDDVALSVAQHVQPEGSTP